jgi:uncharacterized protein (TIGR02118 family)
LERAAQAKIRLRSDSWQTNQKQSSKPLHFCGYGHLTSRRVKMGSVKLVVIYPRPKDIELFERVYKNEHVPMAVEKLGGKTKIVASKIVGSPQGTPPFHRIAEIHFPSIEALQACAASDGGKQTLANAVAISSGGAPIFLIGEEEVFVFQGK